MEQDDQKQAEETKQQNEARDSELSDQDLENVAGGSHGGMSGTPIIQPTN